MMWYFKLYLKRNSTEKLKGNTEYQQFQHAAKSFIWSFIFSNLNYTFLNTSSAFLLNLLNFFYIEHEFDFKKV